MLLWAAAGKNRFFCLGSTASWPSLVPCLSGAPKSWQKAGELRKLVLHSCRHLILFYSHTIHSFLKAGRCLNLLFLKILTLHSHPCPVSVPRSPGLRVGIAEGFPQALIFPAPQFLGCTFSQTHHHLTPAAQRGEGAGLR